MLCSAKGGPLRTQDLGSSPLSRYTRGESWARIQDLGSSRALPITATVAVLALAFVVWLSGWLTRTGAAPRRSRSPQARTSGNKMRRAWGSCLPPSDAEASR
eukprot:scaffold65826_cov62-Phaeocystis_antarctica.AAC.2